MQTGSPTGSPLGSSHPLSSLHVEIVAVQYMERQPQDINLVDDEVRLEYVAAPGDISTVLVVHEDMPTTHSSPIMQQDMELWRTICDYD